MIRRVVGVSVQTGVIMLEYINQMRVNGHSMREAAIEGAVLRLRPIMMTMLVAVQSLGKTPIRPETLNYIHRKNGLNAAPV